MLTEQPTSKAIARSSGRRVALLTQHIAEYGTITIYYRQRTEQPIQVRTFIDFMIKQVADNTRFFLDNSDLRTACRQVPSLRTRSRTLTFNFFT